VVSPKLWFSIQTQTTWVDEPVVPHGPVAAMATEGGRRKTTLIAARIAQPHCPVSAVSSRWSPIHPTGTISLSRNAVVWGLWATSTDRQRLSIMLVFGVSLA